LQHAFDARQIALAHSFQGIRIGRQQLQTGRLLTRLQWHQPGVQIFGAQVTFQTLKAAPPQITHEYFSARDVDANA
jgi:hypothetical protein